MWRFYSEGIVTSAMGCGTTLDHAILLVGYGFEETTDTFTNEATIETSITTRKASRIERRAKSCNDGSTYDIKTKSCITYVTTTSTTEATTVTAS
jgi:hypothetical protein